MLLLTVSLKVFTLIFSEHTITRHQLHPQSVGWHNRVVSVSFQSDTLDTVSFIGTRCNESRKHRSCLLTCKPTVNVRTRTVDCFAASCGSLKVNV